MTGTTPISGHVPGSPLAPEGTTAAVPEARAGQEIQVRHTKWRPDPVAGRPVRAAGDQPGGQRVIYDHGAFDWQGDDYHLPWHHELVIYELHIGSFYTRSEDEGHPRAGDDKFDHLVRLGVNVIQVMPVSEFAGDYRGATTPRTSSPSRARTAARTPSRPSSARRTRRASGVVPTSSTTTSGPATSTCGSSTGGQKRQGRDLLLQRRPLPRPPWRHPAGLRPGGGAPVHPRQRDDVAASTITSTACAST